MRRRVEGDACQTNIWLVTEWLTSGHMQSSNHVYGHQKAADDDWLICKAAWCLHLMCTPEHVPLSLSNLLRLLPCVLSDNIQNHFWLVYYTHTLTFCMDVIPCMIAQMRESFDCITLGYLQKQHIRHPMLFSPVASSPESYLVQQMEHLLQPLVYILEAGDITLLWGMLLRHPGN